MKRGAVKTEKMSFYKQSWHLYQFVRALRLWVRPRQPEEPPEPQQLGHWNVVPLNTKAQGLFSKPKFESLAETLSRVNTLFRQSPLAGSILKIETQDMKCHTSLGTAEPDRCSQEHPGICFVLVLRIFFILGPPALEEIGCADFAPQSQTYKKQRFDGLVGQARSWLDQQQGLRFINIQSIDYKLKTGWGGTKLDTHRTFDCEGGEYVCIVRVSYGRRFSTGPNNMLPPPMPMPQLNYRTFAPICLSSGGLRLPTYETMSQTWMRTKAWLNAANIQQYLSVETVPVLYSGKKQCDHEVTYTRNYGLSSDDESDNIQLWTFVLRVYMNGPCQEPPAEVLPPPPKVEKDDCCVIL